MKYAIIGATLTGNKGAAAMLESSVQHLSEADPDAHFYVLTVYPKADKHLNRNPDVSILDANPLRLGVVINGASLIYKLFPPLRSIIKQRIPEIAAIANSDVLLDEGGITFVDGRGKFLIYNVATILPALLIGTPVVKVAQAMGPFHKIPNRLAAKILLPRIKAIIARGDLTEKYLRELGLRNVYRGTDSAFALQTSDADARSLAAKLDLDFFSDREVIGFAPSVVLARAAEKAGRDYVTESVDLINFITETLNFPIAIIPHSVRVGTEKAHNNDLPISRAIHTCVASPEKVLLVDTELSPRELRLLIGKCHIFIASRFHAMVSALSETVPTLVIGWSHKYGEVLADFAQNDFHLSLAEAKPQRLYPMVSDLLRRHDDVHRELAENLPHVQKLALRQFAVIKEIAAQRQAGKRHGK